MRRHEVDVTSLVFGLFFLGAAAIWGLTENGLLAGHQWPLPALLILVGVIGLLTSLGGRRSRGQPAVDVVSDQHPQPPFQAADAELARTHPAEPVQPRPFEPAGPDGDERGAAEPIDAARRAGPAEPEGPAEPGGAAGRVERSEVVADKPAPGSP